MALCKLLNETAISPNPRLKEHTGAEGLREKEDRKECYEELSAVCDIGHHIHEYIAAVAICKSLVYRDLQKMKEKDQLGKRVTKNRKVIREDNVC